MESKPTDNNPVKKDLPSSLSKVVKPATLKSDLDVLITKHAPGLPGAEQSAMALLKVVQERLTND